jgi:tRNA modification GTPase
MLRAFDDETIAAISTPLGEGGIGIIRLSGKDAIQVADKIFSSKNNKKLRDQKTFTALYGHVVSRENKIEKIIDEVIVLIMRGPKSYTCEDVVEISAHGGQAALQAILALAVKNGARLALEGEFTKRAFLNGRIDLLQAEAVLDLIRAKTEISRQWAASQLEGSLSKKIQKIKNDLVQILSHLEASVDFPDDSPETDSMREIGRKIKACSQDISAILKGSDLGILLKRGLKVVLTGKPNVGKSSLMNKLVRANRVIVTPFAGTTRDVVEEEAQLGGFPVRFLDTAGIQETENFIEKEGIQRTHQAIAAADLVLCVLDASQPLTEKEEIWIESLKEKPKIAILNKSDLPIKVDVEKLKRLIGNTALVTTSCIDPEGIKKLENEIVRFITQDQPAMPDETVVSSVRQKDLLERLKINLDEAFEACENGLSAEFAAVDIRLALNHLGILVGEVVTDDILEVLFNQFCIGK